MKTYLSIDRGASFTDFIIITSDDEILYTRCIPSRNWNEIMENYLKLKKTYSPDLVFYTGSPDNIPPELETTIRKVSEIDAIAFGGAHVSGKEKCIVVSMGTGTAVVLFDKGRSKHIGGTGIGGGTLMGLGKIMSGVTDPLLLNHLALEGKETELNLTLSEVGYRNVGFLGGDITVSNFGSLKSYKKEDSIAAILCMIAEVVGVIASLAAQIYHLEKEIVVIGNLSRSNYIREKLQKVGKLYNTEFKFPGKPEYATAIGAVKSFFKE